MRKLLKSVLLCYSGSFIIRIDFITNAYAGGASILLYPRKRNVKIQHMSHTWWLRTPPLTESEENALVYKPTVRMMGTVDFLAPSDSAL